MGREVKPEYALEPEKASARLTLVVEDKPKDDKGEQAEPKPDQPKPDQPGNEAECCSGRWV